MLPLLRTCKRKPGCNTREKVHSNNYVIERVYVEFSAVITITIYIFVRFVYFLIV